MEVKRIVIVSAEHCLELATDILKLDHDQHGVPGNYSPDLQLMIETQQTLKIILGINPEPSNEKVVLHDAPGSACGGAGRIE